MEQFASLIFEQNRQNLSNVCIVLPNRRAGLYLKKNLSKLFTKPGWSPDIYSVEDFYAHLTNFQVPDPIELNFILYNIHYQIEKEQAQTFDEFIRWSQILISDFNQIDAHLVDAKTIYTYLNEIKALEKWNLNRRKLTETEINYLKFYASLHEYYLRLRAYLLEKNMAYQGLMYRHLAENKHTLLSNLKWNRIYFAGFNAMTKAEEIVTEFLVNEGVAEVFYDSDDYYLNDKRQEAGLFLRKARQKNDVRGFNWVGNHFKEIPKKINIVGVPKHIGQARLAGDIINQWLLDDPDPKNAAVVLADENLLQPVLNSLPQDLQSFNVTMGFSMKNTAIFQFFTLVIKLFENAERFSTTRESTEGAFYYNDLLNIFQHPYISFILEPSRYVNKIKTSNRTFYPPAMLLSILDGSDHNNPPWFKTLFNKLNPDPIQLLEILETLADGFRESITQKKEEDKAAASNFEIEFIYSVARIIHTLKTYHKKYGHISGIKILKELFLLISKSTKIPFYGEPLAGLQILGMLETRTLDFEKVIILTVNEGIIPSGHMANTFIPLDVQQEFNLPAIMEKNAIFAYHFYRLLQRSKEVHLIYNTEPDEMGGGEKSRFILQLIHEMPAYQPQTEFTESVLSIPAPLGGSIRKIEIEKSVDIFNKLISKAHSGLSPTSLNLFRNCPLKFYFQEIAKLEEADEVEETIDYRTIGNIVHDTLEALYQPFIGQIISEETMKVMLSKANESINASFQKKYSGGEINFGRNRLIYEVVKKFVRSFLQYEKSNFNGSNNNYNLEIIGLEKKLETLIDLDNHVRVPIKIKGTIDRIDRLNDQIRIIDYKTGVVVSGDLRLTHWDDLANGDGLDKVFQVLTYAWLYAEHEKENLSDFTTGVFSMRKLTSGFLGFYFQEDGKGPKKYIIDNETLVSYREILNEILIRLFDRNTPFAQTENADTCRLCSYKNMCQR
nr:PD-(D/E)XK nuclease family protein [Bacteroidota bacterium]